MDFYLKTYPGDINITAASTELVLVTFKAIENAVAFYTSHQGTFSCELQSLVAE